MIEVHYQLQYYYNGKKDDVLIYFDDWDTKIDSEDNWGVVTQKKIVELDSYIHNGVSYNSGTIFHKLFYGSDDDSFEESDEHKFDYYSKNAFLIRDGFIEDFPKDWEVILEQYPPEKYLDLKFSFRYLNNGSYIIYTKQSEEFYWSYTFFEVYNEFHLKNSCCDMSSSLQKIKDLLI